MSKVKSLAVSDQAFVSGASSANLPAPLGAVHVVGGSRVVVGSQLLVEVWPRAESNLSHVEGHVNQHVLNACLVGGEAWYTILGTSLSPRQIVLEKLGDLAVSEDPIM